MSVKVTMIGGGAASFVPPLLRKFIESEELGDAQLTLMDVDADRLETMVKLAEKLIDAEVEPAAGDRARSTSASRCATRTS